MKKQISTISGLEEISDIYWIYDDGRIWSDYKNDFLKPIKQYNSDILKKQWEENKLQNEPYHLYIVKLHLKHSEKIKSIGVHRLVAMAFIDNPNNLPEVNHIDKITEHNNINNLEWCDKNYNIQYSLTKKVWKCDKDTHKKLECFDSFAEAAKNVNGNHSNIIAVCKNRRKTAYNYFWEYDE